MALADDSKRRFQDYYVLATEGSRWTIDQDFRACFDWTYDDGRAAMIGLYEKGKQMQWDAQTRIDWSQELDPLNPQGMPDQSLPIHMAPCFLKMSEAEKGEVRRNFQAWQLSQFMQGEQGALICAAKIVTQVPDADAKFYAATQTIDEARHVESYKALLRKFDAVYPMTAPLAELIDQTLRDSRWDMTYLGMQVVIEGLALAAFATIRDNAKNELCAQVNAYVMQDESRHVAFGRLALRDYYPELTQKERDEREEFLLEASHLMRDRFDAVELWQHLGLPIEECAQAMYESGFMEQFRNSLFSRIVPIVKDVGLWGDTVRNGYEQMGVIGYAKTDVQALQDEDEHIARQHDARRAEIQRVIERARSGEGEAVAAE
ncbi:ferritin-like domain-containing protein [Phenylobacterium sp.]|jgi:DNA-binding transcriptional MerR regulator|uniref:ferritin-like domain-containing protein n=1 Tax=Phenylobacterium sp. TaxID=1871053 RepID=UPI002F3FEC2B